MSFAGSFFVFSKLFHLTANGGVPLAFVPSVEALGRTCSSVFREEGGAKKDGRNRTQEGRNNDQPEPGFDERRFDQRQRAERATAELDDDRRPHHDVRRTRQCQWSCGRPGHEPGQCADQQSPAVPQPELSRRRRAPEA